MSDKENAQAKLEHLRAIAKRLRKADSELSNAAINCHVDLNASELGQWVWEASDLTRKILREVEKRIAETVACAGGVK